MQIPVFLEIEPERLETKDRSRRPDPVATLRLLIDRGLRARLESQSILTGQMQVAFDFHTERPARFVRADPGYTEIPTIPTPLQELAKRIEQLPLEQIVKDIGSAVAGINRFVNSPEITKSLRSVSATADEAKDLIGKLDARIDPLVLNIEATVRDAQKLLQNIDRLVEPLGPSIQY
jgi:paraquat-inducible protein B